MVVHGPPYLGKVVHGPLVHRQVVHGPLVHGQVVHGPVGLLVDCRASVIPCSDHQWRSPRNSTWTDFVPYIH